ncbi:MAG: hypothetical protein HFF08_03965 [Oscillospiraceae bacterium]|nr:hypothetical protein [Oscillospiraceae bacterium]
MELSNTLCKKAIHVIGLDYKKPYTRHGKKFYRPYRNRWAGKDAELDQLADAGLMRKNVDETGEHCWYWFTRSGLDWLGEQLDIKILPKDK